MKRLILAIVSVLTIVGGTAYANWQCGIKPLPPLGCSYDDAQCVCSGNSCQWVYVCN